MKYTITQDGNNNAVPVSGSFIIEEIEIDGTAFTDNDLDVPEGCAELMLISDTAFEISDAVDGDGFPVAADIPFIIGVATMAKVWFKGANEQKIQVMYRYL